jgi:hypothetical protein
MNDLRNYLVLLTLVVLIALSLVAPKNSHALGTFSSLGIDGKTMTVRDPAILQKAGLDAKAGDGVSMVKNTDRPGFTIRNLRTGKSIQYPPAGPSTTRKASGAVR